MIEKHFTVKTPSAATVGKFIRNTIAVLVIALTILGSVLYAKVNNEQAVATKAAEELLHSHCSFFKDLGTVKLMPSSTPSGQKVNPSRLGIQIVNDSRKAYAGIGCKPNLPPDPSLAHFAQIEHVSLK